MAGAGAFGGGLSGAGIGALCGVGGGALPGALGGAASGLIAAAFAKDPHGGLCLRFRWRYIWWRRGS